MPGFPDGATEQKGVASTDGDSATGSHGSNDGGLSANDIQRYLENAADLYEKLAKAVNSESPAEELTTLGELMMRNIPPETEKRLMDIFRDTAKELADKDLLSWRARLLEIGAAKRDEIETLSSSLASQMDLNVHIQGSEQAVLAFFTDLQNIEPDQVEERLKQLLTPTSTAQIIESSAFGFLYMLDRENGDGEPWLISAATLEKVVDRESTRVAQELKHADPVRASEVFGSIFKAEYTSTGDSNTAPNIMIGLSNKEQ